MFPSLKKILFATNEELGEITSNSQKEESHWEVGEGAHLDGAPGCEIDAVVTGAGILLVLLVRRLGFERWRLLLLVRCRAM
jgi:hypothetical protein